MAVESVSLQERLERWAQRLQNLTVSPLTRDYPDNQKQELPKRAIEAFESIQLSKETQSDLQKISGSSSGFTVFLTAFIVLVARLTGDEDIAVGTSSSDDGRPFVLRVPIEASETFLQLYAKVQKAFEQGSAEIVPLGSLRSYIQEKSQSERSPVLFRFAAYDAPAASQDYPANTFETTDLVVNIAPISASDGSTTQAELGAYYNQRLFSSSRISTILKQLARLVENATSNPEQAIGRIDFMTEDQLALLPDPTSDLNCTPRDSV
ncbi:hypothetical protein CBS76997_8525 [Aspergillus niger]|nr:hypothetical protein CBS76997_8525 [Aspergillus niger]